MVLHLLTPAECLNNIIGNSITIQSFTAENNTSLIPLLMKTCHGDESENEEAIILAICFS